MNLIVGILVLISIHKNNFMFCQNSDSENNIVFDVPDIAVELELKPNKMIYLEAFKSSLNDRIITNGNKDAYGQLQWLSIGFPSLTAVSSEKNKSKHMLFHRSNDGFYAMISMLTKYQREVLREKVKNKYNISIELNQITNLILSKFECKLQLECETIDFDFKSIEILGKVYQFREFPLRLNFELPIKSSVSLMKCIDDTLLNIENANDLDLDIKCELGTKSRLVKENILSIKGSQLAEHGIIDNLFGPASSALITRDQLTDLSSQILNEFNIIEEYGIPESTFSSTFIDEIIKQMCDHTFQNVPFDVALNSLSKYAIENDIAPDLITSELSNLLEVKKDYSKNHIVLNNENYERLYDKHHSSQSGEAEGSFLGIFSADASFSTVKDREKDWEMSRKSLDDQLKELNSETEHNIQWKFDGAKIIPKSINVAKLNKAKFSKTLMFNRIKKEIYDSSYKRSFPIYTKDYQNMLNLLENTESILVLEKKIENIENALNSKIKQLNSLIDDAKSHLVNKFNLIDNDFTEKNKLSEEKIKNLSENIAYLISRITKIGRCVSCS